jgi:hypothetical protein
MEILIYGDDLFSADIIWGFQELGHTAKRIIPGSIDQLDAILSENEGVELLMTLGSPAYFSSPMLKSLGGRPRPAIKYVHWDTDGITWAGIEMNHINLFQPDMVFTVCPEMLDLFRSKNIRSDMLFYAYSPLSHHPASPDHDHNGLITFLGNAYPDIIRRLPNHYRRLSMDVLFKPLLEDGRRIDFFGDARIRSVIKSLYDFDLPDTWMHGRYPYDKTYLVYSSSFINLVTQNHEHTLTKRLFEVLGSGGFALSYDNTAIRRFFVPDKELVLTFSPQQTLDVIDYYTKEPEAYNAIRKQGAIAALNHTYKQRAAEILEKLQL